MKDLFVDTNVLIDFLADRKPFSADASRLFDMAYKSKIRLFISAVSYNNIYYILRQTISHATSIRILNELMAWTNVVDVTEDIICRSLDSAFTDFEDSIQYFCALSMPSIEIIVTRDSKHFKSSNLPVLNTRETLVLLELEGY